MLEETKRKGKKNIPDTALPCQSRQKWEGTLERTQYFNPIMRAQVQHNTGTSSTACYTICSRDMDGTVHRGRNERHRGRRSRAHARHCFTHAYPRALFRASDRHLHSARHFSVAGQRAPPSIIAGSSARDTSFLSRRSAPLWLVPVAPRVGSDFVLGPCRPCTTRRFCCLFVSCSRLLGGPLQPCRNARASRSSKQRKK